MQWVASTLHTTSEHDVSSITTADAHTSAASSRPNWRPAADLNGLVRFARKTKSDFCACAITFQTQSTIAFPWSSAGVKEWIFVHCLNGLVQFRSLVFSAPCLKPPVFGRLPKITHKFTHGTHYVKYDSRGTAVFRSTPTGSVSINRTFIVADRSISTHVLRCGVDVRSSS